MVEVLVVVAVIAIIASMVVPGLSELRERSGLRAARTLAGAPPRAGVGQWVLTARRPNDRPCGTDRRFTTDGN